MKRERVHVEFFDEKEGEGEDDGGYEVEIVDEG